MAKNANLKNSVAQVVKTNGVKGITGANLQPTILQVIDKLGGGYQFGGLVQPNGTFPVDVNGNSLTDQNFAFLASTPGTYTNFGGLVVNEGEVCVFLWDGTWTKQVTGIATDVELSQLGQDVKISEKTVTIEPNIQPNQDILLFDVLAGDEVKIKNTATSGFRLIVQKNGSVLEQSSDIYSAGSRTFNITKNGQLYVRSFVQQSSSTSVTVSLLNYAYEQREFTNAAIKAVENEVIKTKDDIIGWLDEGTYYNSLDAEFNKVCAILPLLSDKDSAIHLDITDINLAGSYLYYMITSTRQTGTGSAIGDVTYIYNTTARHIDILLTAEQKASGKYLVITCGSSALASFWVQAYLKDSSLPKDYLKAISNNIGRLTAIDGSGYINANNALKKFVFSGTLYTFSGGARVQIPSSISYRWNIYGGGIAAVACIYVKKTGTFTFKQLASVLYSDIVLFTFIASGTVNDSNCVVLNEVFSPILFLVDGKLKKDDSSKLYYGEKIEIGIRTYQNTLMYGSADISLAHCNNAQGADMFDNRYVFQCSVETDECYLSIIDVSSMNCLGELSLSSLGSGLHGNNVNIGDKYDNNDKFPLLYISEADGTNNRWRLFVIRLANDCSSFTLVQTIEFTGSRYESSRHIDWAVDIKKSLLYSYSMDRVSITEICSFSLPNINTSYVNLNDSDIIEYFSVGSQLNQGCKVCENKMYFPKGVLNSTNLPELTVVDLLLKKIVSTVDMTWIGEPQNCFIYNNGLVVGTSGPNYYILQFN